MVKRLMCLLIAFVLPVCSGESAMSQLKKAICFVYSMQGTNVGQPIGTGFWVSVPHVSNTNVFYPYFVTAKHVIATSNRVDLSTIALRVNAKNGGAQFVPLGKLPEQNILTHSDPGVDVVAISVVLNQDTFETIYVPDSLIQSTELLTSLAVEEGDDVFFGGLFTHFHGETNNIPVFRFGKIASMESVRIRTPSGFAQFFLAEAQSYPGFSGSPVFVKESMGKTGRLIARPPRIFLWGIMTGYLKDRNALEVKETAAYAILDSNTGMALISPGNYLREILESERAKTFRASP
jgi:hypothetical protein